MPGEIEKYREIAKDGNYYNGSYDYKKYVNFMESNKLDFMCKNTVKYQNSKSLEKINIYDKIKWWMDMIIWEEKLQ